VDDQQRRAPDAIALVPADGIASAFAIVSSVPGAGRDVRIASGAAPGAPPADQVRYLEKYLSSSSTGARSIIVEHPYVDRHWLEEYSGYYATMLRPPPSKATRLHFLRSEVADADLIRLVHRACEGDREAVESELSDAYLGFSVIRPLASALVGRTVLRPYGDEPLRCFAAGMLEHRVHLAGLRIEFSGLPFQQQDQGAGARASDRHPYPRVSAASVPAGGCAG
jgi:hypothetical protein